MRSDDLDIRLVFLHSISNADLGKLGDDFLRFRGELSESIAYAWLRSQGFDVEDHRKNASLGHPDFLVFREGYRAAVEVKSCGGLSDSQFQWRLANRDIPYWLVYVDY